MVPWLSTSQDDSHGPPCACSVLSVAFLTRLISTCLSNCGSPRNRFLPEFHNAARCIADPVGRRRASRTSFMSRLALSGTGFGSAGPPRSLNSSRIWSSRLISSAISAASLCSVLPGWQRLLQLIQPRIDCRQRISDFVRELLGKPAELVEDLVRDCRHPLRHLVAPPPFRRPKHPQHRHAWLRRPPGIVSSGYSSRLEQGRGDLRSATLARCHGGSSRALAFPPLRAPPAAGEHERSRRGLQSSHWMPVGSDTLGCRASVTSQALTIPPRTGSVFQTSEFASKTNR